MSEEYTEKAVADEVKITPEVVVEKPVEAKPEPTAIKLPEEETTGPGLGNVADGVMGSTQVKGKAKTQEKPVSKPKEDTVAIHSEKNIYWDGVGSVKKGFNIVSKKDADSWLQHKTIRLATPEEVAKGFAK